jgi:hypothetical protein
MNMMSKLGERFAGFIKDEYFNRVYKFANFLESLEGMDFAKQMLVNIESMGRSISIVNTSIEKMIKGFTALPSTDYKLFNTTLKLIRHESEQFGHSIRTALEGAKIGAAALNIVLGYTMGVINETLLGFNKMGQAIGVLIHGTDEYNAAKEAKAKAESDKAQNRSKAGVGIWDSTMDHGIGPNGNPIPFGPQTRARIPGVPLPGARMVPLVRPNMIDGDPRQRPTIPSKMQPVPVSIVGPAANNKYAAPNPYQATTQTWSVQQIHVHGVKDPVDLANKVAAAGKRHVAPHGAIDLNAFQPVG